MTRGVSYGRGFGWVSFGWLLGGVAILVGCEPSSDARNTRSMATQRDAGAQRNSAAPDTGLETPVLDDGAQRPENDASSDEVSSSAPDGDDGESQVDFPCPGSNVTLTTDVDVQALAGCTTIGGSLTVRQSTLTTLSALSSLTAVHGGLLINQNENLINLDGLQQLESVGGSVLVTDNGKLRNMTGLQGLSSIGAALQVSGSAIRELELANLESIEGDVEIDYNPRLERLALPALTRTTGLAIVGNAALALLDLPALSSVEGNLSVSEHQVLTDLQGLGTLTSVRGSLSIQHNDGLTTTRGLDSLIEVRGDVVISSNADLELIEFPALESVGRGGRNNPDGIGPFAAQLYVAYNESLAELSLPSLGFVGVGGVRFYGHPELPQCAVDAVAEQVSKPCDCSDNEGSRACP